MPNFEAFMFLWSLEADVITFLQTPGALYIVPSMLLLLTILCCGPGLFSGRNMATIAKAPETTLQEVATTELEGHRKSRRLLGLTP